jgi:uncharacterized phage protein (TIGR01671 family)
MRELKFKALYKGDLENHKKYLPFVMKIIEDKLMFVMEGDEEFRYPFGMVFMDNDWIKLQYTGLKDKNGIEIYEGDIIKATIPDVKGRYHNMEVFWDNDLARWGQRSIWGKIKKEKIREMYPDFWRCEVIGNIYENPELLKEYK